MKRSALHRGFSTTAWITVFVVAWAGGDNAAQSCTTAVVSGSATKSGRPLLWKNRDFTTIHNVVVDLQGEGHRVVAITTKGTSSSVKMGFNERGLCVENSQSRDLAWPGAKGLGNSEFILHALRRCATVAEFRKLLEETDQRGRSTTGNFGVIDAQGGAAMFEVGPDRHRMYDANDSQVAPDGIIVRSNFSYLGQDLPLDADDETIGKLYSGNRYLRARDLLKSRAAEGIDARFIVRHCARDLCDNKGCVIPGSINATDEQLPDTIDISHTISRGSTVSAAVFEGVLPHESPLLTTMWAVLGDPKFSISVPCWMTSRGVADCLDGPAGSDLCRAAIELRKMHVLHEKEKNEAAGAGTGRKQVVIHTQGLRELWSVILPAQDRIFAQTERQLALRRAQGFDAEQLDKFHRAMAKRALEVLQQATSAAVPAGS